MQSGHIKSLKLFTVSLLGFILFNCGGLQNSKNFVFEQIERKPLIIKATLAYQTGNFAEAGMYYEKLLNSNQDDAIIAYNLACCYARQSDVDKAAFFLTYAFTKGFRRLDVFENDTDFDSVREHPIFKEASAGIYQRFKSIGTKDYVEAPSMLPYRIRFPENYDASRSYPLLIGMHGMGGNSDGFVAQYDKLENPQIIYVTPEAPYLLSMNVGPQWHMRAWSLTNVGKQAKLSADKLVSDYILQAIDKISLEYKISNVYLMGFSEGAVYAYTVGIQNPDKIEGVIGFSGYLMSVEGDKSILTQQDIEEGQDVRLFIAHGIDDAAIDVETARALKAMFEEQGYDLTYREFNGRHNIKANIFNDAVSWMQL